MTDPTSPGQLWEQVCENFSQDDGSLPAVEIVNLTPQDVSTLYALIRAGSRLVSAVALWDLVSERDRAIDDVGNAGALVATGQLAPFHFVVDQVNAPEHAIPPLGVQVFQECIAIDWRMGPDWGHEEVWAFFVWLQDLVSRTQAGFLELADDGPPEGEKFMAAWAQFMASCAPHYLESTVALVSHAYPDGIPDEDYDAVLEVLLERLSFHNISALFAALLPPRVGAYHDALRVSGQPELVSQDARERVATRLRLHGMEAWLAEPD